MPDDSKRVPFTNMIYMGDGLSDVPCMKMMRAYGGQAIAVYQASNRQGVEKLLADGRVDFIFPADYREGMELDRTVRDILRKMTIIDRRWRSTIPASSGSIGGDVPDQSGVCSEHGISYHRNVYAKTGAENAVSASFFLFFPGKSFTYSIVSGKLYAVY